MRRLSIMPGSDEHETTTDRGTNKPTPRDGARQTPGLPQGSPEFLTTRWSVVVAAGETPSPRSREALDSLAANYWYPIYASIRRKGYDSQRACDLTQGFFLHVLDGNRLAGYSPEKGRFRAYLRGAVGNFLASERERENALKRGGGSQHFSIDAEDAEQRLAFEPSHEETPDRDFDRRWAHALLELALTRLRGEYDERDQGNLFEALLPFLNDSDGDDSYALIADELGMKPGAVRVAVHRLRKRYGQALRMEVSGTLHDPSLAEDELKELLRVLS